MDQNHTIRAHFISTLDVIRVDGAAPGDPRPEDATVSDPRENGTAEHPFDGIQEAIDVAADGVRSSSAPAPTTKTSTSQARAFTFWESIRRRLVMQPIR